MYYYAVDRWNSGDSLAHYKYIKKIKIGPYTRYFYSMKDLQNYYNSTRKEWNKEDLSDPRLDMQSAKRDLATAELLVKNPISKFAMDNGLIKDTEGNPVSYKDASNLVDDIGTMVKRVKKGINRKNSLQAAIATGKFAVKSMLGFSSKKDAKQNYKYERYYQPLSISDLSDDFVSGYALSKMPRRSRKKLRSLGE